MHISAKKEEFSIAYLHAVATVAGYSVTKYGRDNDGIDVILTKQDDPNEPNIICRAPHLSVQLKCTEIDCVSGDSVSFPLKVRNYEKLRQTNYHVPRILVLVIVPKQLEHWLRQDEYTLAMCHCGYWHSLMGMQGTGNVGTETVKIPRTRQFTVEALHGIMSRIEAGKLL